MLCWIYEFWVEVTKIFGPERKLRNFVGQNRTLVPLTRVWSIRVKWWVKLTRFWMNLQQFRSLLSEPNKTLMRHNIFYSVGCMTGRLVSISLLPRSEKCSVETTSWNTLSDRNYRQRNDPILVSKSTIIIDVDVDSTSMCEYAGIRT